MVSTVELISKGNQSLVPGLNSMFLETVFLPLSRNCRMASYLLIHKLVLLGAGIYPSVQAHT